MQETVGKAVNPFLAAAKRDMVLYPHSYLISCSLVSSQGLQYFVANTVTFRTEKDIYPS